MAVSGADVEKIKDEIDPRFNELSIAIENLKLAAKEQEAKEKVQRRHDVIMRAVQNINPEIQSGRLTNGWNCWGTNFNEQYKPRQQLALPGKISNQSTYYLSGSFIYTDDDEKYSVCLGFPVYENAPKVYYTMNDGDVSYVTDIHVTDFSGIPRMLFADKELDYFAVNVDNNKVRLYERQETNFTFAIQIDFTGEVISSMEGGGNMIFITTQSKKVFGIRRNSKGSFSKLTHTELGIDIEGNLVYSKCTPDGKTVVFVNASGYTKGKDFIRIYEFDGSIYRKKALDVTNRKYKNSPSFDINSNKARKSLLISKNGDTILVFDDSFSFTVIRKNNDGYTVVPTSFVYYGITSQFKDNKSDIVLSDCGRYLFLVKVNKSSSGIVVSFFYLDLFQDYLSMAIFDLGGFFISTYYGISYPDGIVDFTLLRGKVLRIIYCSSQENNYRVSNVHYVEIPWEV